MAIRIPSREEALWLVAAGLPPAGPFPLRSTDLDPGFFGPGSVTWRVMREPLLLLGASRALLVQVAHPLVAQGALDHSDFTRDAVGRFQRTVAWVTTVVFGTKDEARAATREVNRAHRKVVGRLPAEHATASWQAGSAYRAQDQELILWVHAALVESMLVTHDAVIGGLRPHERDRFVAEWDQVVTMMGMPDGAGWEGYGQLQAWMDRRVAEGVARPGAGSRAVADVVLVPRLGMSGPRALAELTGFVTSGLLPRPIRRHYGIRWTPAHELAHRAMRASLRAARGTLPRPLRVSPVYDFAVARAAGELRRRPELQEALATQPRLA